jgi:predicted MFS family arabinose efflux permease
MQGNFSLYTQKIFNYGPEKNGYLFTFIGLVSVFTQLKLLPFALQKTTEKTLFKLGLFILSFGFLLIPLAMHISTILLSILFIAVGNGFVNPTIQSIASENVSRDKYGETLGVLQSMGSVGRIAGPIIGGELFLAVSAPAPFIFAGTIMLIIFAYAIWQIPEERTLLQKVTGFFKKN